MTVTSSQRGTLILVGAVGIEPTSVCLRGRYITILSDSQFHSQEHLPIRRLARRGTLIVGVLENEPGHCIRAKNLCATLGLVLPNVGSSVGSSPSWFFLFRDPLTRLASKTTLGNHFRSSPGLFGFSLLTLRGLLPGEGDRFQCAHDSFARQPSAGTVARIGWF